MHRNLPIQPRPVQGEHHEGTERRKIYKTNVTCRNRPMTGAALASVSVCQSQRQCHPSIDAQVKKKGKQREVKKMSSDSSIQTKHRRFRCFRLCSSSFDRLNPRLCAKTSQAGTGRGSRPHFLPRPAIPTTGRRAIGRSVAGPFVAAHSPWAEERRQPRRPDAIVIVIVIAVTIITTAVARSDACGYGRILGHWK